MLLARTYVKLGQLGQAYRLFFNVVTLDPNNLEAQVKLGQIALLAGRINEAKERSALVLKKKPDDVEALVLAAQAAARQNDVVSAFKYLKKARGLAPQRADVRVLLGQLNLKEGRTDLATEEYLAAIKIAPKLLTPGCC